MKCHWFVVTAFILTGCSSLGLVQADKRNWTAVSCSGFKGWDECKERALQACPKGYDVANQEENQAIQKRTMEYACKE